MKILVFLGFLVALWNRFLQIIARKRDPDKVHGSPVSRGSQSVNVVPKRDPDTMGCRRWTHLGSQNADRSLRQGAGGTEFARFGSRTCFLRWFHRRSQAYFCQTWRTRFFHQKTLSGGLKRRFLRKMCCLIFFWAFPTLQGPGPGSYGPIWPLWVHKDQKNPKEYVRN